MPTLSDTAAEPTGRATDPIISTLRRNDDGDDTPDRAVDTVDGRAECTMCGTCGGVWSRVVCVMVASVILVSQRGDPDSDHLPWRADALDDAAPAYAGDRPERD